MKLVPLNDSFSLLVYCRLNNQPVREEPELVISATGILMKLLPSLLVYYNETILMNEGFTLSLLVYDGYK